MKFFYFYTLFFCVALTFWFLRSFGRADPGVYPVLDFHLMFFVGLGVVVLFVRFKNWIKWFLWFLCVTASVFFHPDVWGHWIYLNYPDHLNFSLSFLALLAMGWGGYLLLSCVRLRFISIPIAIYMIASLAYNIWFPYIAI
ncbi:hypothetical protein [Ottowia testudinis]|uniref:Uncharacterized protein n=1 Tax=Ottowia testudinis TaxID=2816950 RepID=A0A975CJY6_9BURK|nr:hypothetical protein [Ottowia testudinis]QTD46387.1 hypothetical protein J1M35_05720 [Ottowia testudinis]